MTIPARSSHQKKYLPKLCFFHLPRTGGTALSKDILFRNFPRWRFCHVNYSSDLRPLEGADDPLRWSKLRRAGIRVLAGHMPFGFASRFTGTFDYITFIRDPIERTASEYHFLRLSRSNPASAAAHRLSLIEFVEGRHGTSNNCYARWLSNAAFGAVFSSDAEMLGAALKNLDQFSFVGITEQFESSVQRLCQQYGLVPHRARAQNRNRATPPGFALSAVELRVIERHNLLDLAIYYRTLEDSRWGAEATPVGSTNRRR